MRAAAIKRHSRVDHAEDSLSVYLQAIRAYPLLSSAEEVELAQRIRAGDADALERLVCANLRFVVSIAKKYQHLGLPLADLVNEGNLGLMRAARRFDDGKGVRFISYAVWWIRQAIFQTLAEYSRPVRIPVGKAGELRRLRNAGDDSGALGASVSL